jgi:hypothetical protein
VTCVLEQALRAAADALLALVNGGIAPPELRLPLLFYCVPLLEAAPPAVTLEDAEALLARVEVLGRGAVFRVFLGQGFLSDGPCFAGERQGAPLCHRPAWAFLLCRATH